MSAFPQIPVIRYEGPKSKNPFAFKHYNADEKVAGYRSGSLDGHWYEY